MKIFISYRRDDSAGYAGRLFDHLAARFGAKNVFMDIDTIEPGEDFRTVVENAVSTCDVVLAMIGKQWLSLSDAQGGRRLDDPRDWVRIEIATALANSRVRVIPVLVRDASMPGGDLSLTQWKRHWHWPLMRSMAPALFSTFTVRATPPRSSAPPMAPPVPPPAAS